MTSLRAFLVITLLSISPVYSQTMLPASYLNPYDAGWNDIINAGPNRVPITLLNPNSGPGAGPNDGHVLAYKFLARRLQGAGHKVFGYVDTSYGRVPINTVLTQIGQYYSWIGVDGIFFDQTHYDCNLLWYYRQPYEEVKRRGGLSILNPGAPSSECYMSVGDIHLTAEIDWNYYQNGYQTASWVWKYSASRFYHVAYNVPSWSMPAALSLARSRNAGHVFFTELGLPNPYGKLPSYFWAQISALVLPASPPPPPPPTTRPTTQPPTTQPPTTQPPTTQPPTTQPPTTQPPTTQPPTTQPPTTQPPTTQPPTTQPPTTQPPTTQPPTTQPPTSQPPPPSIDPLPSTIQPTTIERSTSPPIDSSTPVTDEPSPVNPIATNPPPMAAILGRASTPTTSAHLDPPADAPTDTLVWQYMSASVSDSGNDLVIWTTSYNRFTLNSQVQFYIHTDSNVKPEVIIKGNQLLSPTLTSHALDMTVIDSTLNFTIPLSYFPSALYLLRVYALNSRTDQRIPTTDSLQVLLPAFAAHVVFTALPLSTDDELLDDQGGVYQDHDHGFSFGWTSDNVVPPSTCVTFSARNWSIAVPFASFYRVRALLAAPAASACVGLIVESSDTSIGPRCSDVANAAEHVLLERTVLVTDERLELAPYGGLNPDQQICELVVTVVTGTILESTLTLKETTAMDEASLSSSLSALTGEPTHRFTLLSTKTTKKREQHTTLSFSYLIADSWLTSSAVSSADIAARIIAATPEQWTAATPYDHVRTNLISTSGQPVPSSYTPLPRNAAKSTPARGSSDSNGLLIGLVVGTIVFIIVAIAAFLFVYYPVPIWKRESPWVFSLSSTDVAAGSSATPRRETPSTLSLSDVSMPVNSATMLVPSPNNA